MSEHTPEISKSSTGQSNDPSMDDILASIRRIIADDTDGAGDDVLELDNVVDPLIESPSIDAGLEDLIVTTDTPSEEDLLVSVDDFLTMDESKHAAQTLEAKSRGLFDTSELEPESTADILENDMLMTSDEPETSSDTLLELIDLDVSGKDLKADTPASGDEDILSILSNDIDLIVEDDEFDDFLAVSEPQATSTLTDVNLSVNSDTVLSAEDEDLLEIPPTIHQEGGRRFSDFEPGLVTPEPHIEESDADRLVTDVESMLAKSDGSAEMDMNADADLDLVKSLMAGLIDDPVDDAESLDNAPSEDTHAPDTDQSLSQDVVDDILDLTLSDEESLAPADLLEETVSEQILEEAEPQTDHLEASKTNKPQTDEEIVDSIDAGINSLLAIAAAADADANENEFAALEPKESALIEEDSLDSIAPELDPPIEDEQTLDAAVQEAIEDREEASVLEADIDPAPLTSPDTQEPALDIPTLDIEDLAVDILGVDTPDSDILDTVEAADEPVDVIEPEVLVASDDSDLKALANELIGREVMETTFDEPEVVVEENESQALVSVEKPDSVDQEEIPDMSKLAANNRILDEVTETAAIEAFASLNKAVDEKVTLEEQGPRIGDIVADALRPMLKEWLDDNLKGIVERAVKAEVKRISSGK